MANGEDFGGSQSVLSQSLPTRVAKSGSAALQQQMDLNSEFRDTQRGQDLMVEREKRLRTEERLRNLYQFSFDNWRESDVEKFAYHRDILASRIQAGFYDEENGNGGYNKFLKDLQGLSDAYESFVPTESQLGQIEDLETMVTTGKSPYMGYDVTTNMEDLQDRRDLHNSGLIQEGSEYFNEETMQWEGTWLDLDGNVVTGQDGQPMKGPIVDNPFRDSQELWMPSLKAVEGVSVEDMAGYYASAILQKIRNQGFTEDAALDQLKAELIEQMENVSEMEKQNTTFATDGQEGLMRQALVTAEELYGQEAEMGGVTKITRYVEDIIEMIKNNNLPNLIKEKDAERERDLTTQLRESNNDLNPGNEE